MSNGDVCSKCGEPFRYGDAVSFGQDGVCHGGCAEAPTIVVGDPERLVPLLPEWTTEGQTLSQLRQLTESIKELTIALKERH